MYSFYLQIIFALVLVLISYGIPYYRVQLELREAEERAALSPELTHQVDQQQTNLVNSLSGCVIPARPTMDVHSHLGEISQDICEHKLDEQVDFFLDAGKHMQRTATSEGYDFLIGTHFKVKYRFAYIRTMDDFLYNPRKREYLGPGAGEVQYCKFSHDNGTEFRISNVSKHIKLDTLNYQSRLSTRIEKTFSFEDACIVHVIFVAFNGK
jgi:hypothetical protein